MPLSILLPMVVIGVAGIAVLLHVMGLSQPRRFADADEARAAWDREFPEIPANAATLCHDGSAALIATDEGPGVVWPMGADSTARRIDHARIERTTDGLILRLPDFTAPRIRLRLDGDETTEWLDRLEQSA